MAFLAPNARWQGRDTTGQPVVNGKLYTYVAGTTTPKATWMDFEQTTPNTNPVVLDGSGEANIYWGDDSYYNIALYTSTGTEVYTQDNYPYLVNPNVAPPIDITQKNNIVRNPQFSFWSNGTSLSNLNTSANNYDFIADDWLFRKTNTSSVINASQIALNLTDVSVPGFPPYVLDINCTSIGTLTETQLEIYQRYGSVRTFAGIAVTLSFSAKCLNSPSATIECIAYQDFGTGGSPSSPVPTTFGTFTVNNSMQEFSATIILPMLTGKTQGTNLDDSLQLAFSLPQNLIFEIQLGTVQWQEGSTVLSFDYSSQNDQQLSLYRNTTKFFQTGDYKFTLRNSADPGWLMCDDGSIGSLTSASTNCGMFTQALYVLLWNTVPNSICPIFTSAGVLSTRGDSAISDFNANKQLAVTKTLGRVLAGASSSTIETAYYGGVFGNSGGLVFSITDTSSLHTGDAVSFTASIALPSNIAINTLYYVYIINPTTIALCTSLANALLPTPARIGYADSGSGTFVMYAAQPAHALGSFAGQETHALTQPELPVTQPTIIPSSPNSTVLQNSALTTLYQGLSEPGGGIDQADIPLISPFGGSIAHNILQPTSYQNVMIKL